MNGYGVRIFWLKFILCCSNKKNITYIYRYFFYERKKHWTFSIDQNSIHHDFRYVSLRIVVKKKWQMILAGIEILSKVPFTHTRIVKCNFCMRKYLKRLTQTQPLSISCTYKDRICCSWKSNRLESNFYFCTICL